MWTVVEIRRSQSSSERDEDEDELDPSESESQSINEGVLVYVPELPGRSREDCGVEFNSKF